MKRISEIRPLWQRQLPMLHALEPWGLARLNRLFRTVADHPDSPRLNAVLMEWGMRSGLFTQETAADLVKTKMGYLAYWIQPRASARVAQLMGKFLLWTISTDDTLGERGAPLGDLKRACDEIIRTGQTHMPLVPQARFFFELRRELLDMGCAGLLPQIADQTELTFLATEREQRFMRDDVLPTLHGYLNLRLGTSFMVGPVHAQRCEKGLLPPSRHFDERLEQLVALACVIVMLNGDIAGYRKDLEMSFFPMNVIPIIAIDFSVDLATAYRMSLDLTELYRNMLDERVAAVCAEQSSDPESAAQARAIEQWLHGFHTWHTRGERHGSASAQVKQPALPEWQSGPLLQLLSQRPLADTSLPGLTERRPAWEPSGLGTSTARWNAAQGATPAEQLTGWAADTLGLSGLKEHGAKSGAGGGSATVRIPRPTGIGTSAARINPLGSGK